MACLNGCGVLTRCAGAGGSVNERSVVSARSAELNSLRTVAKVTQFFFLKLSQALFILSVLV